MSTDPTTPRAEVSSGGLPDDRRPAGSRLCLDLNADLGEGAAHDAELLTLVTSANIACGFHAGDPASVLATLAAARDAGVNAGAHPSLADREGFGRRELPVTPDKVFALALYQLGAFAALANAAGIHPRHAKPHGALYNMAARDPALADAVARAVSASDRSLVLFAPSGSALAAAGEARGLRVACEVFADRNYLADGSLVPREHPDALVRDPRAAADRVLRTLRTGRVQAIDGSEFPVKMDTVCIHGDSPAAVAFARTLRAELLRAGVELHSIR